MRKLPFNSCSLVILLIAITGCSIKWTDAIRYGSIARQEFKETIDIDIRRGLIFVPVRIDGKEYRFLFDSGAPLSISDELQKENDFKIISKGSIRDSDHNQKKVLWAQIDTLEIGEVSFMNQSAFIGNFEANPILKCMEIDGIIGSNLMRQCHWTIDQKNESLTLSSTIDTTALQDQIKIPFKSNYQYSVFLDLKIGSATVSNVLMDYGSNGSVSLSHEIFATLEERNIIENPLIETGVKQSGIIGDPTPIRRKISYSDSVGMGSSTIPKVMLQTGKTTSIGNDLLSRYVVTIDWDNKNLYLAKTDKVSRLNRPAGFKLGYSEDSGIYVQSVIENSNAYNAGVRPNMKATKIDTLDFEKSHDFCDYIDHESMDTIFLQLIDLQGQRREYQIERKEY